MLRTVMLPVWYSQKTDVFLLLVYGFFKRNFEQLWCMKYDSKKYENIKTFYEYLGNK